MSPAYAHEDGILRLHAHRALCDHQEQLISYRELVDMVRDSSGLEMTSHVMWQVSQWTHVLTYWHENDFYYTVAFPLDIDVEIEE